jgi:hypothetical protein
VHADLVRLLLRLREYLVDCLEVVILAVALVECRRAAWTTQSDATRRGDVVVVLQTA